MKSHEQCKEMGKRLKAVRQSLGITQEKMAETMDVSVRQYRRYEYQANNSPAHKSIAT